MWVGRPKRMRGTTTVSHVGVSMAVGVWLHLTSEELSEIESEVARRARRLVSSCATCQWCGVGGRVGARAWRGRVVAPRCFTSGGASGVRVVAALPGCGVLLCARRHARAEVACVVRVPEPVRRLCAGGCGPWPCVCVWYDRGQPAAKGTPHDPRTAVTAVTPRRSTRFTRWAARTIRRAGTDRYGARRRLHLRNRHAERVRG